MEAENEELVSWKAVGKKFGQAQSGYGSPY